ncbi:hypothetical protein COMNV_00062 [Commensalibacter sp. Nvir]|uniref:OmpH family outer membrane protein n=1 Tax=Commensalibacter sp. Nvir TaxID=3069817 RepID=UPI002D5D7AC8|nr:hypothetical protein COMNV_00062 [Commensalibacter sp. Nvir]
MVNNFKTCFAILRVLAAPALSTLCISQANAQDNNGWFIPKTSQSKPAVTTKAPKKQQANKGEETPIADSAMDDNAQMNMQNQQTQPILPLPPIPTPAPIAKSNPPPQVMVGVISVPDVMRQSTAAREAEKTLVSRRDSLQQDVQREQKSWRAEQQQVQAKAKSMTADQIQMRERKLQIRVLSAQKDFRNRSRIIQEAAQVAFGQIERELVQIIQKVAFSKNMNLVLHREQVALSVNELDITDEVSKELNKNLPSVFIPAANVDPEELAKSGTMPTTGDVQSTPSAPEKSVVIKQPAK